MLTEIHSKEIIEKMDNKTKEEYLKYKDNYDIINMLITTRKNMGLTQKELAQRLGLKQQEISKIETKVQMPSYKKLQKIANELGLKLVLIKR
ncbi:hypothetical protein SH1V18_48150 [Vallitalea longa]|uniref:HTH cro/C1-type domain-containing protein n=1 Tax=Vallitalea longa TaxID=2936439 RepID=A0A9W5YDY3_9FIRM|nr:helix-turn-helix transcriptional regulator [Vallitalea longa]GKX32335.1 hypothetical protein SH1V18_48150 [Vallitalea longa]